MFREETMAAPYDLNDDSVVVIIGSGAGGGTLGNELAQKGIDVVVLEAGARIEHEDFINDEWDSFSQLAWLDNRTTGGGWRVSKDFPNLPAWIVKAVGGTTTHWAGASLRIQDHEFKTLTNYGKVEGANLLDWPVTLADLEPYYAKAEDKMGVTRTNGIPGPARQQQLQGAEGRRRQARLQGMCTPGGWRSTASRSRRPHELPADRLLFPGLQVGRQMVDALHRNPEGRSDRQSGGAPEFHGRQDRA
jgi:choline dehydrogenase-like flavoprotein